MLESCCESIQVEKHTKSLRSSAMNTHTTDKLLVYGRVFCLNLTLPYSALSGNPNFPLLRQKEWERPSQIGTETKYKASGHFLPVPMAKVLKHLCQQPWCFRVHTGCRTTHCSTTSGALPDSRTAPGTNGAIRNQIYFYLFIFTGKQTTC